MATATLIPVSEYLATTYRPDCDYVDGELQERHVGERSHAIMQTVLAVFFTVNRAQWRAIAATELRVQVSPLRFRIPDVCVLRRSDPVEPIVHKAPLVCIEVLSPEDTLSRLQARIDDYAAIGVENIWVLDPLRRRAYSASVRGLQEPADRILTVSGTPIRIALDDLFAEYDDLMRQE